MQDPIAPLVVVVLTALIMGTIAYWSIRILLRMIIWTVGLFALWSILYHLQVVPAPLEIVQRAADWAWMHKDEGQKIISHFFH